MFNKILILLFILFFIKYSHSQSFSHYHLKSKTTQIFNFNPAEISDARLNISLLNFNVSLNHNIILNDILKKAPTSDIKFKNYLQTGNLIKTIRANGETIDVDFSSNLLYIGLKLQEGFGFSIFSNAKSYSVFDWPTTLLKIITEGNGGDNLGVTFNDNIFIDSGSYIEAGIGIHKGFVNERLQIGVHFKYLYGLAYAGTGDDMSLSFNTEINTFHINVTRKNYELQGLLAKENSGLNSGNGYAGDFGFSYDLEYKDQGLPLRVSASIIDIGNITWEDINVSSATDGTKTVRSFVNESDEEKSFFDKLVPETTPSKKTFTKTLPIKILSSVEYRLTNNHIFTGSYFNRFYRGRTNSLAALGFTSKLWKEHFNISINGIRHLTNNYNSLGLAASVNLGFFQIYAASDDIISAINIKSSNRYHFTFGMNLLFKRKKIKTEKRDEYNWNWNTKPANEEDKNIF